ncbi:hypothetical protein EZ428_15770 [Pedobacter frigiditerrae]|uniref:SbsA Ig-like domain-containing protein n=1 Tax=Pedobacter frigiditerrae TaxID=2530452 RepID=A0A4R0MQL7_9SPHI|nr:hypothetical protein [Pedobacter frigiditerrae]TCC89158.1 hypothetical protein EZ428_15770 [Pedobacter frigiditerrae]
MVKTFKFKNLKNTRLCFKYGLVFLLLAFFAACKKSENKLSIVYAKQFPVGIQIPKGLIKGAIDDLKVIDQNAVAKVSILGVFKDQDSIVLFKPLIPLTFGFQYQIYDGEKLIGSIQVPTPKNNAPKIVKIYPDVDTIPENLLKIYIAFSKPMRTGESLNYITLLDKKGDTMRNVFLNLQPELWDTTGKVLTVWLDPGRIKRDLILNQKLGNPLKTAQAYQLVISPSWKDHQGLALAKEYKRKFIAGKRDDQIPDVKKWLISRPIPNIRSSLNITTGEYLDHYLLLESIEVLDDKGKTVRGEVKVNAGESWMFTPKQNWRKGIYQLKIDNRLEDLAANNLNRVFDRDVRKDKQQNKTFTYLSFKVEH